jgi:hypothetical protein
MRIAADGVARCRAGHRSVGYAGDSLGAQLPFRIRHDTECPGAPPIGSGQVV